MTTTAITTTQMSRPMKLAQTLVLELALVAVVVAAIVDGLTVMHGVVGLLVADALAITLLEQRRASRDG